VALKQAYADLFVLLSKPTDADLQLLEGKFKSTHNVSDRVAKLLASTFYSLLALADINSTGKATASEQEKPDNAPAKLANEKREDVEALTEDDRAHSREVESP
jgi:hypothetical protein